MSIYNIREKFSYILTTSSIDYVRNYNFNSALVSDIPLVLINSDDTIPITVDMTTSEDWIRIVDPNTAKSVKLPQGNVVVEPSSSKTVLVKIDLPPEIEQIPETVIYPTIDFKLRSGSFLLVSAEEESGTGSSPIDKLIVPTDITLKVGETQIITLKLYDLNGAEEDGGQVEWNIENMSVAQFKQDATEATEGLDRRIIQGISPGTTIITYTVPGRQIRESTNVTTTIEQVAGPIDTCGNKCTESADCTGKCNNCVDNICTESERL